MRKRKAARSVSSSRSDKACRCKNAVSDSWFRASSVACAFSSLSLLLLLRAGASPPHSLSSGENSTLPSPSQLSATPSASTGAVVSLAVSTRTSLTRSIGPSQLSGSASELAAWLFSCSRPKSSRGAKSSISFSRNGLSSSIWSISSLSSKVESCNKRMDC